jgi:hypothetical protein
LGLPRRRWQLWRRDELHRPTAKGCQCHRLQHSLAGAFRSKRRRSE